MGWLKHLSTTCIILSAAVCVSCQELASTLREENRTCPGEEVIFNCTIRGSSTLPVLVLEWRSAEYIGRDGSLQLSTTDSLGEVEESMIDGIVTATATLINHTNIGGVLILESTLRIIANEASVVTCSGTNGVTESIEFSISAIPEAPQMISAAEVSRLEIICIVLVQWDPPAISDPSDISQYIVYVPSQNIREVAGHFTISTVTVPNCGDDTRIQVAAVNRIGCVGMNSTAVQPVLLNIPTEHGSATTKGGSATTTSTTVDGSLSIGGIVGITIGGTVITMGVLIAIVVSVLKICCGIYRKRNVNQDIEQPKDRFKMETLNSRQTKEQVTEPQHEMQETQQEQVTQLKIQLSSTQEELKKLKQQQTMESVSRLCSVINYDLQGLYKALILQSRSSIRMSARSLLRKLTKDAAQISEDVIKAALIEFLKELNGDTELKDALDTLSDLVKVQSIHSSMEEMIAILMHGAGIKNGLDRVIEKTEKESSGDVEEMDTTVTHEAGIKNGFDSVIKKIEESPVEVKEILKKLCEQFRNVQDEPQNRSRAGSHASTLSGVSQRNLPGALGGVSQRNILPSPLASKCNSPNLPRATS